MSLIVVPPPSGNTATVHLSVDDDYTYLYLNGQAYTPGPNHINWQQADTFSGIVDLNCIAVRAVNGDPGGWGALIAKVEFSDGTSAVSDTSWRVYYASDSSPPPADGQGRPWYHPDYDDSAWSAPISYGAYGAGPWNTQSGLSMMAGAQWIWLAETPHGKGASPVYLRKRFGSGTQPSPPSAPSALSATAVSQTQINLSWIDNSANESGFKIERKTGASGAWAQIGTVGADVTTYSDTSGLAPGTTYTYQVRATNAAGDSAYSNPASATTPGNLPPPPAYEGHFDEATCDHLSGWAWDTNQPTTPISVDLYDGNSTTPFATVLADNFRQDLLNAGKGDGKHGFSLPTPASLKDGQVHVLHARFAGTNTELFDSPKSLQCQDVAPPPSLLRVDLDPTSVVGGNSSSGTVTLSGPAPSGGAQVSLSSSNTAVASVPGSVTVASGATSAPFTVSTSAVSSSTAVTISATYNVVTKTADLTVNPGVSTTPDFQLSAAPSSLSLLRGSSGSTVITITPLNGFSGVVNLSLSGAPAGVTGTFSPQSATTSSTLTLLVGSTVPANVYDLVVTGESGGRTHTTPVQLTVRTNSSGGGGGTPQADVPAPGWAEDVIPVDSVEADGAGPSSASGVNLASGVYENQPGPDMVARNPVGPDAVYARRYRSALAARGYAAPGLSVGWTDNYDVTLQGASAGVAAQSLAAATSTTPSAGGLVLNYPNGAQEQVASGGTLSAPAGAPYRVAGQAAGSTTGRWSEVRFTFKDETTWTFRPTANNPDLYRLVRSANSLGQGINVYWNGTGRLLTLTNDNNAVLLTFGGTGYYTSLTDAHGRVVRFTFGPAAGTTCLTEVAQVAQVGGAAGTMEWRYGYEPVAGQPYLNQVSVPHPNEAGTTATQTIQYVNGFVGSVQDANRNQRVYNYAGATTNVQVLDGTSGDLVEQWTQKNGSKNEDQGTVDAANNASTIVYDPGNGYYPAQAVNENNQTVTLDYDKTGNRYDVRTVTTPAPGGSLTTTYTYDYSVFAQGRVESVQVGAKGATSFTYFEPSGLIKSVTTPAPYGSGVSTVTTSYTYTARGNVETVTRPGNNAAASLTYTYNYTNDPGVPGEPGYIEPYSKAEALGEPVTITDPLGHVTRFRYDPRGNVVTVFDPERIRTDFEYYEGTDRLKRVIYPRATPTSPGRAYTQYAYRYPNGDGPLLATQIYDESGALFREVNAGLGAEGEEKSQSGSVPTVAVGYDGQYRIKNIADGKSQTTSHNFDPVGNLTSRVYPGGAPGAAANDRTVFGHYDANGTLVSGYDPAGNLTERTDGRNILTKYLRASDDSRVTGVQYVGQAGQDVTFEHDIYGRVRSMTNAQAEVRYEYDDLDNLVRSYTYFKRADGSWLGSNGTWSRNTYQVEYAYHPDGSRRYMILSENKGGSGADARSHAAYEYDGAGRFTSLTFGGAQSSGQGSPIGQKKWTYLDNGWLASQMNYGYGTSFGTTGRNGIESRYVYNARGQLTNLKNKKADYFSQQPGAILSEYGNITHDAVGNITAMTVNVPNEAAFSGTVTYGYNTKDELTYESTSGNYNYDAAGNATTFAGASRSYNEKNQLSGQSYDNNGNPTAYAGAALTFDAEDRLTGVSGRMTAGYRGDGLRAWKESGGNRTYYVYDGTTPVMEVNQYGGTTAFITYGANGLTERFFVSTNPDSYLSSILYAFDPLGNTSERVDYLNNLISRRSNLAYGGVRTQNAVSWPFYNADPYQGHKGKFGYQLDPETGLYLCTFRYYDPQTGRFLNRDPIGYAGGINLYAYASNNPVMEADPDGLCPECVHYSRSPSISAYHPTRWERAKKWLAYQWDEQVVGTFRWYGDLGEYAGKKFVAEVADTSHWYGQLGANAVGSITGRPQGAGGATGKGRRFEDELQARLNNRGSFKIQGLDFDGRWGRVWYEAKAGWHKMMENPKEVAHFMSKTGAQRAVAKKMGRHFMILSKEPIPAKIKNWLIKGGYSFREM